MSSPVVEVLRSLAAALNGLGEGWYLFGAQAALLRGSHRLTADVDVTVLPGATSNVALARALTENGFSLRFADVDEFVARTRVLPVVHDATHMPVDVVIGGPGIEQLFLEESERMVLDDVEISIPSAEHLVVMKLLAARDLDLEDAAAIVQASDLDIQAVEALIEAIADGLGEDEPRRALEQLRARLGPRPDDS